MSDINFNIVERIAIIRFDSIETMNGLTSQNIRKFNETINYLNMRNDVDIIIISGRNDYFCTGASGELLLQLKESTFQERLTILKKAQDIVLSIIGSKTICLGYINGLVSGSGIDIMLSCDIIFATPNAKMSIAYNKIGVIPDLGGLSLMSEFIGMKKSLLLFYETKTLNQDNLIELFSAKPLNAPIESDEEWIKILKRYLRSNLFSFSKLKSLLWKLKRDSFICHLEETRYIQAELMGSSYFSDKLDTLLGVKKLSKFI